MNVKKTSNDSEREEISEDLNGLLLFCKQHNTYFTVYCSREKRTVMLVLTDNPKYFNNLTPAETETYVPLPRIDLNLSKMFIGYLDPRHLLFNYGQTLGIRFPLKTIRVKNMLDDKSRHLYILEGPIKFLPDIISRMQELVSMKPQIKYEIIDKFLVTNY